MLGLGWGELIVILVIVIAIFGAGRLAGLGSALGGSIREFKNAVKDDDGATMTTSEPKAAITAPATKTEGETKV